MNKAIGYTRVSTQEQAVNNMSLVNQAEAIERYCKENGFELVRIFEDAGESAKTTNRPNLQAAIAFCENPGNAVEYFIVWKVDRFTRSFYDHATVALKLKAAGTKLRSVTENIDETSSGRFVGNMLSAVAQFDNDMRAERVVSGMNKRKAQGGWPHPAPLGYHNSRNAEGIPTLTIQGGEAFRLRRWFTEYLKRDLTIKEMRDLAVEMNMKSRKNNLISIQQVRNMLSNPVYAGYVGTDSEGRLIKGLHPAVIPPELYEEIQDKLLGRNKAYKTTDDELWPLRGGFIRCADCGSPLTSSTPRGRSGKRFMSYSCPKCRVSQVGHRVSIPRETLHNEFLTLLQTIKPTDAHLKARGEHFKKYFKAQMKDVNEEVRRLSADINSLDQRRKRVLERFVDGQLTLSDKETMLGEIDEKIAAHTHRVHSIKMNDTDMDVIVDFVMKVISHLDTTWSELSDTVASKRKMQSTIFPEGLVYDFQEGFRTPKTTILYEVLKGNKGQKVKYGTPGWN